MVSSRVDPAGTLYRLSCLRFTGCVRFRYGKRWHSARLRRGLIHAAAPAGPDLLGQLLVEQGTLGPRDLFRSLERLSATDRPQGELLREMGLVSAADLERALSAQLRRRLLRLLSLGPADEVQTREGAGRPRLLGPCRPLDPLTVVWEHVRRLPATGLEGLRRELSGLLVGLRPGAEAALGPTGRAGLELLLALRRPPSLELLAPDPGRLRVLLYLSLLGLLERREAPPPVRADAAAVLDLPADASPAQARRAFHRLALRLHPDRHPTAPPGERARLAERFARVAAAYRELSRHAS